MGFLFFSPPPRATQATTDAMKSTAALALLVLCAAALTSGFKHKLKKAKEYKEAEEESWPTPKFSKPKSKSKDGCEIVWDDVWEEKCKTVYHDDCWETSEKSCSTISTKVCGTTYKKKCELVMKDKCSTFTLPKCSFVWEKKCKDVTKCKDVWDKVCEDHPKTTCKTVHDKECKDVTERVCEDVTIRVVPDAVKYDYPVEYSSAPTYETSEESAEETSDEEAVWPEEDRYTRSIHRKLEKLQDKIDSKFEKEEPWVTKEVKAVPVETERVCKDVVSKKCQKV